jgi:hypothetical protein
MKNYRQLLKELPSKKVVFAFGRFQPPTTGHELLVKAVQKLAASQKADHVIYASKTEDKKQNPLPVSRKVYYLQRMFPGINFRAANEQVRTFIEAAKELNKKYKNIVMVAGSDRVPEYKKLLEKYNGTEFHFDTVTVVSAGDRDPDSDTASGMSGTKMREAAKAGNFTEFKKGVPKTLTDLDARRLMNEIRKVYDMAPLKESLNIQVDELREKYFRGEIFNVGDMVVCEDKSYTVIKRGSNHLLLQEQGTDVKVNRWIRDVKLAEDFENPEEHNQITFQGYTTKHFDQCPGAVDAFNNLIHKGIGEHKDVLTALMATDEYLAHEKAAKGIGSATAESLAHFNTHVKKATESLSKIGDLEHHDYISGHIETMKGLASEYKDAVWDELRDSREIKKPLIDEALTNKTLKASSADQIKAARIIATTLGVDNVESMSNPAQIVNTGLRKVKSKALNPESYSILQRMLKMATDIGIEYDTNLLPAKLKEAYYDKLLSYDAEGKVTEIDADKDGIPDWIERHLTVGSSLHNDPTNDNVRKQKVMYHLGEAEGDPKKMAREVAKAALAAKHAREKEQLSKKHESEKERIAEEEIFEAIDKEHPIAKEYEALKKHDIKSLRGMIKQQHKIIDTSEFRTKEHAVSHLLRAKHGNKKVAAVFGLKEENLDEAAPFKDLHSAVKYASDKVKTHRDNLDGIEVYKHKSGGYDVNHTMNSNGRNALRGSGAKHLGTVYKDKPHNIKEENVEEDYVQAADQKIGKDGKKHAARLIKIGSDGPGEKRVTGRDAFSEEEEHEITDQEIDAMVNNITDWEHVIDAYDDDELALIDDETGEELESTIKEEVEQINEVLSRIERIKAKTRFARTKTKRMVKVKLALKRSSPQATINKRARRLAIKNLKMRIAKKPLSSLSVAEKERLEQRVQKMKPVLNRIAMKLAPKVRQIEKQRLSHSGYTK